MKFPPYSIGPLQSNTRQAQVNHINIGALTRPDPIATTI
ncbi:hypothetical protein AKJ16_DCAP24537 [Drosera capensis]